MLKVVRLDYRLLHGQVVFAWTRNMGIDYIVVADNKADSDNFLKMSLSLAKPASIGLEILSTKEAIRLINGGRYIRKTVMLICGNTKELLELVESIDDIKNINYGNVGKKQGSKMYTQQVFLTEGEVEDTRKILEKKVNIQIQMLPTTEITELTKSNL